MDNGRSPTLQAVRNWLVLVMVLSAYGLARSQPVPDAPGAADALANAPRLEWSAGASGDAAGASAAAPVQHLQGVLWNAPPATAGLRWGVGLRQERGAGALAHGLGAPMAAETQPGSTLGVLALSTQASTRTRLLLESRWAARSAPDGAGSSGWGRPVGVGLAVQSSRGAAVSGLRSLARVQLTADSSLQWRPRRGGLLISYSSNF